MQPMIKHNPQFDTDKVCETYSQRDGVDITYVCTTDLRASDTPVDVFYRETPHPQFGNRYFGIYYDYYRDGTFIIGADVVEELEFGMIQDNEGTYHYSQSHHDYKEIDGQMIDGGRQYIRSSGVTTVFKVKDGQFIEIG